MSAAAVAIVNAAISRNGGNLITGTDFGTGVSTDGDEKNIAFLNYEQIVGVALLSDPWRFARKTGPCTLVVDGDNVPVPPDDVSWKYQWTLPGDALGLRTLIRCGFIIPYEISEAGTVLTNYLDQVFAVYTKRADESVWPADFKEGVTQRVEAVYLRSESRLPEADDRDASAKAMFDKAALNHSQEEAPTDRRVFPLIAVRRTGYGACPR